MSSIPGRERGASPSSESSCQPSQFPEAPRKHIACSSQHLIAQQTIASVVSVSSAIATTSNPSTSITTVSEAAVSSQPSLVTTSSAPAPSLQTGSVITTASRVTSPSITSESSAILQVTSSTATVTAHPTGTVALSSGAVALSTGTVALSTGTITSSCSKVMPSATVLPSVLRKVTSASTATTAPSSKVESQDLFASDDIQLSKAEDTQDEDDVIEASLDALPLGPSTSSLECKLKSEPRESGTSSLLDASSSSSPSVDPDSNSSDAKVLVDYAKLKKNKVCEISPTIERRRKGISEVDVESTVSRKITFTSTSDEPKIASERLHKPAAFPDDEDDEVTVLDSFNESLEVVYDAHRQTHHRPSAPADSSMAVDSQDVHLFLPRGTQSETQSLIPSTSSRASQSAGFVARLSSSDELSQFSSSESLQCHDTLSSNSGSQSCIVDDSQVPAGTINPTQLESLLGDVDPPVHSQSPDIEPLLSDPLNSGAEQASAREKALFSKKHEAKKIEESSSTSEDTLSKSVARSSRVDSKVDPSKFSSLPPVGIEESQSNISPSIEIIETSKPKVKSPTKYKDQCHQSLIMDSAPSQPSSSDSSSSSHSNGVVDASEAHKLTTTRGQIGVPSSPKPSPDQALEGRIKWPEISSSLLEGSSSLQCSGTIIAKASKAAQKIVLAAERKHIEQQVQHSPRKKTVLEHNSMESLSIEQLADDGNVQTGAENLHETAPRIQVEDHSRECFTPESGGVSQKQKSKEGKTPLSSDSSGAVESVSGKDVRRTSTPNESRLAAGVSPSISEEGGSYIEKEHPSNSLDEATESREVHEDVPEESLPKSCSTMSTVELPIEDLPVLPSFKSVDEVRSKGFVLQEVLELKVWRNPADNSIVYTSEKGDEEFIARSLPFVRKVSKSGSRDKRISDVSTTTSSSSGYNADKSSSSSSCSRRMSSLTQAESITAAKNRLSIESVQIVQPGADEEPKQFALPSNRPFKTKSPRVPSFVSEETSSSDDRDLISAPRTMGYGSFRAGRGKFSHKMRIKSTIPEHPEPPGDAGAASTEVVDLTGFDAPEQKKEVEVRDHKPAEHKTLPRTGIANKGLHYELDKFFGDLEDPIIDVLRSVQMSEEEEETFFSGDINSEVSMLDIHEEQARMVINRMISLTMAPNMLVFAKYHDHYYSAIIESEHPSGGWHIRFTLDGFQKHCPIEHILPIDILPRGQHCFRRYQGPSNNKSIVSVDVIIKGHTVENNTVLHIAADAHQIFKVPHSHLSMNLSDAERFVNAWKVTQSIVSTGPEVSLNNIVCGKRRRGPASGSPSLLKADNTLSSPSTPNKGRTVRKKRKQKGDPNLDSSLTETDVTVAGDGDDQAPDVAETDADFSDSSKRPKKRRTLEEEGATASAASVYETTPVRSRVHPRVREIIADEVSEEDDPSDDETYSVASKSSKRASSRKKARSSPKKKMAVRRLAVSLEVNPSLATSESSIALHSVDETSVSSKPDVSERLASEGEEDAGDDKSLPRKRGRKPKRKAQDSGPSLELPIDRNIASASADSSIPHNQTPKKRGRPPAGSGSSESTSLQKQAKLDDGGSTPRRRTDSGDDSLLGTEETSSGTLSRRTSTRSRSSEASDETELPSATSAVTPSSPAAARAATASSVPHRMSPSVSPAPGASPSGSRHTPSGGRASKSSLSPLGSRSARGRQSRKDRRTGLRSRLDTIEESDASAAASPYKDDHLLDPGTDPRLGTVPPKGSTIFQGYTVLITDSGASKPRGLDDDSGDEDDVPPLNRRHLTEQLRTGGGVVITKFEEADLIRVRQATFSGGAESSSGGRLLLLCDKPCRTTKYIQCLVVGIPIVSHRWVITASDMNQRRDWESFVLPAGLNIVTNTVVEQNPGVVRHRPGDMVRDSPLLEGDVVFVATSSNERFAETWLPLLAIAAAEVRRPPKSISSLGRVLDRKTTIVLADSSIPSAELSRAQQLGKPVVSSEWFIQSVIVGYKLPCDYHPSFRHDAPLSA
ncbi:BRCT domain [Trinorchestia longiramus]|nr:BRCT domain [Trinorchestia longiramus]